MPSVLQKVIYFQAAAAHTGSCVDPYHLINSALLTAFYADSHVYKTFLPAV